MIIAAFKSEITPFWYKRICEATFFVSLVLVCLYFLAHFAPGAGTSSWLQIPDLAFWFACVSTLVSLAGLIVQKQQKYHFGMALANYLLIAATTASLIVLSGGSNSAFIALWLLVAVFAAMFGWQIWLIMLFVANAGVVWEIFFGGEIPDLEQIIKLILIAEAPLITSFVLWHAETGQPTNQKAYNALAQQLSQVANKSEIVINSIGDGVVAVDKAGLVQLINPSAQAILGWSKQDAIGLDYRSLIKLVDLKGKPIEEQLSPVKQVLASNKPMSSNDFGLLTKSGKTARMSLLVSPVSGNQSAEGAILVFRDITQEKEQERQRAEFISTASHEMRTPVAAIEGYLGLAMNPQTAVIDDKARSYLQKAYESTQHLGRLFQDLLTVSRAEDGRLQTKPTVLDIISFTREIVEGLEQKAKDKNISLVYTPGKVIDTKVQPAYFVYADPDQMREVLNNLVDNGIKYTKEGSVTVDVTGDQQNVAISITDTGIGIPPEDTVHLFQKFYRVDNTDTREIGGTGLGLFIARQLVEANNGHVTVESTYGKGSTFTVRLPRMANEQAAAVKGQATKTVPLV
ncbi:MAG TPA: ATP-binding protein [Candidatus Saccharimonadales bacterium]|nr:ATP-binding protein [Candidatus Saccharimonadales bacterium]